jgi:CheY-like chemotaxis protein
MMEKPIGKDILKGWDVVVVDDEFDSLMVAEVILTEHGATVHTAENGSDGLALVRGVRPRFVISDLSMPVMDGWGMIHEMMQDRMTADIPVIALTAHAMVGDRERAIASGFRNYLTKPLTASTFMQDLLRLLTDIPEVAQYLTKT